jgi:hypothetical protein
MTQSSIIDFYRQETAAKEFFKVKETLGNSTLEHKIPIYGMEPYNTPEDLLATAQAFKSLAERMNWTDDECNRIFTSCLMDAAAIEWTDTVNDISGTFHDNLEAFLLKYIPEPDAFLNLQTYLSKIRMTKRFNVHTYVSRFQHINAIASILPQAYGNDLLSDTQLIQYAYNGLPQAWQDKFYEQGHSLHNQTLVSLKNHISRYEKTTLYKNKEQDNRNPKRHTDSNDKEPTSQNNQATKQTDKKTSMDEQPCPFPGHHGHPWKNCFTYNPNAPGYRGHSHKKNDTNAQEEPKESHAIEMDTHAIDMDTLQEQVTKCVLQVLKELKKKKTKNKEVTYDAYWFKDDYDPDRDDAPVDIPEIGLQLPSPPSPNELLQENKDAFLFEVNCDTVSSISNSPIDPTPPSKDSDGPKYFDVEFNEPPPPKVITPTPGTGSTASVSTTTVNKKRRKEKSFFDESSTDTAFSTSDTIAGLSTNSNVNQSTDPPPRGKNFQHIKAKAKNRRKHHLKCKRSRSSDIFASSSESET